MKKLRVADLFAGVGGFSYGFIEEGFDVVFAIEYDEKIAKSYQYNHKNVDMIVDDINNIDIKKRLLQYKGNIHVVIGGPPCQGFSLKGKKMGLLDKRNYLFRKYYEVVEFLKPKYFVIENVPGLFNSCKGVFKSEIKSIFSKIGYRMDFKILNAYNFGVPQMRRRAFVLGRLGDREISLPDKGKRPLVNTWDAISDLAYLNSGEGEYEANYKYPPKTQYQIEIRKGSKKLYNHQATNHSSIALERLRIIPPESGKEFLPKKHITKSIFGETWGRLEKNKPSPTLTTRFDTPSNGRNSHPYLDRSITPREAARLQSFPDKFIFIGNKTSVIKQIGNAVPVILGKAIAKTILEDIS